MTGYAQAVSRTFGIEWDAYADRMPRFTPSCAAARRRFLQTAGARRARLQHVLSDPSFGGP